MIVADRRTHCKIVAGALAGAISLVMVGIAARPAAIGATVAHVQPNGTVLKAGKPTISVSAAAPIMR